MCFLQVGIGCGDRFLGGRSFRLLTLLAGLGVLQLFVGGVQDWFETFGRLLHPLQIFDCDALVLKDDRGEAQFVVDGGNLSPGFGQDLLFGGGDAGGGSGYFLSLGNFRLRGCDELVSGGDVFLEEIEFAGEFAEFAVLG